MSGGSDEKLVGLSAIFLALFFHWFRFVLMASLSSAGAACHFVSVASWC